MKKDTTRHVLLGMFIALAASGYFTAYASVKFPGPDPNVSRARADKGTWTLENAVISMEWASSDGTLKPLRLTNKLSGKSFDQTGAELFRLATTQQTSERKGIQVAVRLDAERVYALASKDGMAWTTLATYPRSEFPGEPRLVRVGKMDTHAEARNHSTNGPVGEGCITELMPRPESIPSGRFDFKTTAHEAKVAEYPFPAGSKLVSCRIDKGTDQGLSWSSALALIWEDGRKFILVGVRNTRPVFNVTTEKGERETGARLIDCPAMNLPASSFKLAKEPVVSRMEPDKKGVRVADRIGGMALDADLISSAGVRVHWRAELRDGSSYIRQNIRLAASDPGPVSLFGIEMLDVIVPDLATIGTCPGSPVVGGGFFLGVEIPGSEPFQLDPARARIGFCCKLTISSEQAYDFSAVTGVAPEGQLRRSFLCYVERERARPSEPFLHYNGWYDLGYSVDAKGMLDVATQFDKELVKKRGVPVESYLVDDGWDDTARGLWAENEKRFPGGLKKFRTEMEAMNAHLGIWISPLGGYGGAKERRAFARKMGLIPGNGELDLSYPAYRQWFQDRCLQLMREGGVNAFKWDKAGEGVSPHFMALLDIARNLRKENPKLFINVTVGTWPSPFWLLHVDSTWRNGSADVGWAGVGDDREKWITFRDGQCRACFARKSPLYPLNSVMHHGLVHGRCFQGEKVGKAGTDLKNEARSYFATGAMLQEMYLTPAMMTQDGWDRVAEAATWAHANADVLADAHWIGGDPLKLEPYGYAAWTDRKGTLMLRNPGDKEQEITLDIADVFELPAGAPTCYRLTSPYKDQRLQEQTMESARPVTFRLKPFEVVVFDAAGTR